MNLNSKKSLNLTMNDTTYSGEQFSFADYELNSDDVILSCYTVNSSMGGRVIFILSDNENLTGNIVSSSGSSTWNPISKTTSLLGLSQAGGFDVAKAQNTINALSQKYGKPIYIYTFQNGVQFYDERSTANIIISNSYYCNEYGSGGVGASTQGKISPYVAFDIGDGENIAGNNRLPSSVGKLLEKANGDLSKDIGDPYNPVEPTPDNDGELDLTLGSAGTGNGYNTYKLKWNVAKDSESVNYSEMEMVVRMGQNAGESKEFKRVKVGNGGSFDFSYTNAVSVAGWSWLDKLKDKLPILDPSPTYMTISFEVNNVRLPLIGFVALLNYNGSVGIDSDTEQYDDYNNLYKFVGGNAEDENTKKDMDDDDEDKDDDETADDDDDFRGGTDSVNGSALLTTSYALTIANIHKFGSWLWSGSLFSDTNAIQLVNNNPIENITACKLFPFSVTGTNTTVQLGNVMSDVSAQKLAENVARTFVFNGGNAITIPKYYSLSSNYGGKYAFLDASPYTTCRIYLPYIGIKDLDPNEVLGVPIHIKYYVDLVTGMCRCVIQSNSKNLYVFDGQIGQDVPITSSNRAQVEVGYITGGLQAVTNIAMGAMTGNIAGIVSGITGAVDTATNMYHSQTSGTPTPCNSRFDSQKAYVIIDRPDVPSVPSGFEHQNGRICNKTMTISNLSGYVELDNTVDLSGIQCFENERVELLSILSSGFYV